MVFWIIVTVLVVAVLGYGYICRVPHGRVDFRTGVVLKFMPSLDHREPIALRRSLEIFSAKYKHLFNIPIQRIKDADVDTSVGSIPCRLYDDSAEGLSKDLILYIHGGGWCIGSINVFEEQSRRIAKATGIPLICFNYSLAPEFPFPRAHEESLALAQQLLQGTPFVSFERLILIGDSAGGNMALSIARDLSNSQYTDRLKAIVAIYPVTNASGPLTQSMQDYSSHYYLTAKAMLNFTQALIKDPTQLKDPRIDLLNTDGWENLPPTMVLTAQFDPLRDEGEAMAIKLEQAGVKVRTRRYNHTVHAFFGLSGFGARGLEAVKDVGDFLKAL